ncbi:Transcription factor CBF/NF-Y/archaeal histone domain, partial [Dillenia turbinata]
GFAFQFFMADGPASPGGCGSHESGDQSPRSNFREQDRYLPIANISRIMKKALPANGKIAKDAKETLQECVSEFISFITSEASDKCQKEKRKTINGDDLLWAMATLGFEDYIDPLKVYLHRFREVNLRIFSFLSCLPTYRGERSLCMKVMPKDLLGVQMDLLNEIRL